MLEDSYPTKAVPRNFFATPLQYNVPPSCFPYSYSIPVLPGLDICHNFYRQTVQVEKKNVVCLFVYIL